MCFFVVGIHPCGPAAPKLPFVPVERRPPDKPPSWISLNTSLVGHDTCTMTEVHACTIIIAHACTMIIVHACTMIIVHACTVIIEHVCTMIIVHACTMIIVQACNMIVVCACTMTIAYVSCPRELLFHDVEGGGAGKGEASQWSKGIWGGPGPQWYLCGETSVITW